MPNNYINKLSTKYHINKNDLEKDWEEAKKIVDKTKYRDSYYAVVMNIFKKMINSRYGLNENIIKKLTFKQYWLVEKYIKTTC